jgi:hypothetical protein
MAVGQTTGGSSMSYVVMFGTGVYGPFDTKEDAVAFRAANRAAMKMQGEVRPLLPVLSQVSDLDKIIAGEFIGLQYCRVKGYHGINVDDLGYCNACGERVDDLLDAKSV